MRDYTQKDKNVWILNSPDEKIVVKIALDGHGQLYYNVLKDAKTVFYDSPLGISTDKANFSSELSFLSERRQTICESYTLMTGKRANCINHANELILRLKKKNHIMDFIMRAYNDGIAYRYFIPHHGNISVYNESSSFKIPKDSIGWAHEFVPHYEGFYNYRTFDELCKMEAGMPILIKTTDDCWALIAEAGVYGDYCGSHILGSGNDDGLLKVVFAPDQKNEIRSVCPFYTPWRVAIIGTKLSAIVESALIENLSPECELIDTSWIKPGRTAWSWWSGDPTDDYGTATGYVDFAASMGWEYYLCDAGWNEDWIPQLVNYAKEKGIGIWLWCHYKDLDTDDEIFDKLVRWASYGIKGMKVDFFESDSQERIRLYDKLAKACANLKLMLNYHGATKPAGERRRWPHIMTREGVLGAEYYRWSDGPTAEHNCTLPFTRNIIGAMDYTPVTFSNNREQTTWAHQLALSVIFESGIQHFADKPDGYYAIGEAAQFLKDCPTVWDDTILLDGYPGKYVSIARQRANKWFLASICGNNMSRDIELKLDFLESGICYNANIYKDGDNAKSIIVEHNTVKASDRIKIQLNKNGGCCISFYPTSPGL
ncbi:glycoside hydrolase family 97 protein [Mahella australiensis]|uniref:Glycoside hydrolase 97 n=1 Tax=Mahella australiensis (strain DSM 15567 / CIP 107919 / 50-1 BON) TaxID=697281 RepID=F3ZY18_MAHA5|nr:glycoside hydrolase family 97 protein [Mahella australiensis]AEE97714.1 Glycoside hydrolase 97 [Mahella australiensis 50-1 BON]